MSHTASKYITLLKMFSLLKICLKMYLSINCISLFKMGLLDSYCSSLFKLCHSTQNVSLLLKNVYLYLKCIFTQNVYLSTQNVSMVKNYISIPSIFKFVSMVKNQYKSLHKSLFKSL